MCLIFLNVAHHQQPKHIDICCLCVSLQICNIPWTCLFCLTKTIEIISTFGHASILEGGFVEFDKYKLEVFKVLSCWTSSNFMVVEKHGLDFSNVWRFEMVNFGLVNFGRNGVDCFEVQV